MKKIIYIAEPSDFDLHDQWFVMAHNLEDTGDVERIAGPFADQADAQAEAQRLQAQYGIPSPESHVLTGRIAFHGNGGYTSVQFWIGGPRLREIETEMIPPELRQIGTWVTFQFPTFTVLGPSEPAEWPWDEPYGGFSI